MSRVPELDWIFDFPAGANPPVASSAVPFVFGSLALAGILIYTGKHEVISPLPKGDADGLRETQLSRRGTPTYKVGHPGGFGEVRLLRA